MLDGLEEDASSHAMLSYFEMREFDRPQTREEFERFCYWQTRRFTSAAGKTHKTEHGEETLRGSVDAGTPECDVNERAWQRVDWLARKENPDQLSRIEVHDVLRLMGDLPPDLKRMAVKIAEGASLPEAAKELGVSLSDAMKMHRAARMLVKWFAEVDEDEKKAAPTVSSHASVRARQRYDLYLTAEDVNHIVKQIDAAPVISEHEERLIVDIRGRLIPVVYNRMRKHLITVLPHEAARA